MMSSAWRTALLMQVDHVLRQMKHVAVKLVGSRVTFNPPPADTDQDVLCLVSDVDEAAARLAFMGFKTDGSPEDYTGCEDSFFSMKKGELNFLLTEDPRFFEQFTLASSLAKRLNVLVKSDRIALFQAILYQARADDLELI